MESSPTAVTLGLASGPRWDSLDIPDGWEPVAALCRQIAQDPDRLVDRIVKGIRAEIPVYRETTPISDPDLRASVVGSLGLTLVGVAERRSPRAEELRVRGELGGRRATQGLPVDSVLQAYLVGYRLLWDELVARSQERDARARDLLLSAAATVWLWVHELTEAVGTGYQDQVRRVEALTLTRQRRLIDELRNGDLSSDRPADLARQAGFDPGGTFRVACAPVHDGAHPDLRAGQRNGTRGVQLRVEVEQTLWIVGQGITAEDALSAVNAILGEVPTGIGLQRLGLPGARMSLGDAERALAVSQLRGEPCNYEACWLAATLLPAKDRLDELLSPGRAAIERHPDLATTVSAFAESGLSQSAAARRLGIHTNTAGYRLTRWSELTGWDPRSGQGLMLSLAALATHPRSET
jgi:hypothetical protein